MAKGCYIGVDGKARKVKKGYVGVGGVARKIKKAYIGVGGVARPCWGGEGVEYYGTITPLSKNEPSFAGASNPNYAIFARNGDAYNKTLTKTTISGYAYSDHAGASIGNYALFAGGYNSNRYAPVSTVIGYDENLTRDGNINVLKEAVYYLGGASNANYAIFAGGNTGSGTMDTAYATAYNAELTKSTPTHMGNGGYYVTGVSTDSHAFFSGFYGNNASWKYVKSYDINLTRTNCEDLTTARTRVGGASNNTYAFFAGGCKAMTYSSRTFYDEVEAYDKNLTKTTCTPLNSKKYFLAGEGIGRYVVFVGGTDKTTQYSDAEVYDETLTKTIVTNISTARYNLGSATLGNYMLFAGGVPSTTAVDVYVVND